MRTYQIWRDPHDLIANVDADYMTRDREEPNTFRFWIRGEHWWNKHHMVAAIENGERRVFVTSDGEAVLTDESLLHTVALPPDPAVVFWETAPDSTKIFIAARLDPCPTVEQIFQPFSKLPQALQGAIYASPHFRSAQSFRAGNPQEVLSAKALSK